MVYDLAARYIRGIQIRHYIKREYLNLTERNFRRKIIFKVPAPGEKILSGNFVLVSYEWANGHTPTQIPLRKQYQARSVGSSIKKELFQNLVKKPISSTVEYHESRPSACTPEDREVNPYYNKTGGKRYITFAKSKIVTKKFGGKDYASLNGHPDLMARRFRVGGVEKVNYIISSP